MNKYRFLPFALALLALVGLVALQSAAEDKPTGDRGSEKGTTTKGMGTYTGKIVRVDADKHTIVLGDIQGRGGKGSGSGTSSGSGTGSGTGSDKAGSSDKATGSDKTASDTGDKGKTGNRTMTFSVSDKTRISLDGKEAKLSELKSGLYARVTTDRSGKGGSGGSGTTGDKSSGTSGTNNADDKSSGAAGAGRDTEKGGTGSSADRVRTATRVEAFTKAPTDTKSGTGSGTRGTDR